MSSALATAAATPAAPAAGLSLAGIAGMLLALLLVLALILAMAWLLRRIGGIGPGGGRGLAAVATLPVGPKERILVVQAGDTQLVVGVTAQQVTLLHRLEAPLPTPAAPEGFATLLARLRREVPQ